MSEIPVRNHREGLLTGLGAKNSSGEYIGKRGRRVCEVCLGPVSKGKRICSPRCRLIKWAAYALREAYRAGRAEGLREVIERLKGIGS